jgi:hypothetical protein
MYYSYVEIEYVVTSFSPTRTDLVLKLLTILVALTAMMLLTHLTVVTLLVKPTVSVMPTMLASLVMVTMVMVTTVMALLTILVAMTAMMLVTHLTVMTLSAKEKRKGNQYSNLREEVTTIADLMDLTIMKLTAVMAMTMFLVGTEKRIGKDIDDDDNVVGKTCDGDNGDGDNSDGIVNNIGGNDSNYVVNSLSAMDGHDHLLLN